MMLGVLADRLLDFDRAAGRDHRCRQQGHMSSSGGKDAD